MAQADNIEKHLRFVLYMGAARAQATPEQLDRLRARADEMQACIKVGDYARCKLVIREIMPEGWVPGPEWTWPSG